MAVPSAPAGPEVSVLDRYRGALLGLACGDALGTTVEFLARDSFPPVTDIVGGGPFKLQPGQWTDDTSMAMCLAESLVACPDFDARDQMQRYLAWFTSGYWSALPHCFDVGMTTELALVRFRKTHEPMSGSTDPDTAGNGSLMRLVPVVLRYAPDLDRVLHFAAESSRTTHGAPQAVQACRLLAFVLAGLLEGQDPGTALAGAEAVVSDAKLLRIARGSFLGKPRSRIQSSGYAVHSLEAALWCLHRADSFEQALLLAANLGDDADTVAAITGQLAGARHGVAAIPSHWLDRLHRANEIDALALALHACRDRAMHE